MDFISEFVLKIVVGVIGLLAAIYAWIAKRTINRVDALEKDMATAKTDLAVGRNKMDHIVTSVDEVKSNTRRIETLLIDALKK